MKKKKYFEFLFLIVLGGLSSLSLPPYNIVIINFITLSLLFIYIFQKKRSIIQSHSFFYGWLFGFGYFLSNLYWITISLTFDTNFNYLIPFALILIPGFLAIFYGIITYFFFLIKIKNLISNLFLFSILYGLVEFVRGSIFTGFPWNLIAYSFSKNLEIIQIISLIGTYSFNLLCVTFFTVPAIFVLREKRKELAVCIFFLISPIILYISGSSKINFFKSLDVVENDYVIRVLGSNIDLDRFYKDVNEIDVIKELIEISNPDSVNKTVFLWPEGIIPNVNQSELKEFDFLFDKLLNKNHLLALGINSFENYDGNKYFNSLSIYDHKLNLVNSYEKVKLVPFGEFLPFERILGKIGLSSLTNNYQSFSSGDNREIISLKNNGFDFQILPLICYEIIYSGRIFKNNDFDYIVNISEDGWFGNSIGPHQHFTHSIFRAIESGKYILRSSNNGIAAIINPSGYVEKKIPLGESGYIDFSEKRVLNSTLFSQHGNKMFLIIILLYIFLIFSFNRIS